MELARRKEIALLLLAVGANVDTRDFQMRTPLMLTSHSGYYDLVRLLLEHGANVILKDSDSRTALHYACSSLSLHVVNLLLSNGADAGALSIPPPHAFFVGHNTIRAKARTGRHLRGNVKKSAEWSALHDALYPAQPGSLWYSDELSDQHGVNNASQVIAVQSKLPIKRTKVSDEVTCFQLVSDGPGVSEAALFVGVLDRTDKLEDALA